MTPAVIEFVDIAGLVKGASKGEGLGNQFLANIREVDAIVHVVRCFEDSNVVHVDGSVNPLRDIETINLELIFSDVEILERRIAKSVQDGAKNDKELAKEVAFLERTESPSGGWQAGKQPVRVDDEDEQAWIASYNLLTCKPVIYAANVSEDDLADDGASNAYVAAVREYRSRATTVRCLSSAPRSRRRSPSWRTMRRQDVPGGSGTEGVRPGETDRGKLPPAGADELPDLRRGRDPSMDHQGRARKRPRLPVRSTPILSAASSGPRW